MLTLFLPRAILCKGASRTDKGKEAYRVVVFSKPNWRNTRILSNSCRPAQCMRKPERDHFRINAFSLCTKQMQQTQIFSLVVDFFPKQIHFFVTGRVLLRTSWSKIGHDEIIMKFTVWYNLSYIFLRAPKQDCIMKNWLIKVSFNCSVLTVLISVKPLTKTELRHRRHFVPTASSFL